MYIVAMMEVLFAQFTKNRFEVMLHINMLDLLRFAQCAKKIQKVLGLVHC
jgi:hypothetical protein